VQSDLDIRRYIISNSEQCMDECDVIIWAEAQTLSMKQPDVGAKASPSLKRPQTTAPAYNRRSKPTRRDEAITKTGRRTVASLVLVHHALPRPVTTTSQTHSHHRSCKCAKKKITDGNAHAATGSTRGLTKPGWETRSELNRFDKFFHHYKQHEICKKCYITTRLASPTRVFLTRA